uniref:Ovule protein n=1 Tax=Steinernema glaseri TaxID=37863 RepID=A0A1I7YH25_9BILA
MKEIHSEKRDGLKSKAIGDNDWETLSRESICSMSIQLIKVRCISLASCSLVSSSDLLANGKICKSQWVRTLTVYRRFDSRLS